MKCASLDEVSHVGGWEKLLKDTFYVTMSEQGVAFRYFWLMVTVLGFCNVLSYFIKQVEENGSKHFTTAFRLKAKFMNAFSRR